MWLVFFRNTDPLIKHFYRNIFAIATYCYANLQSIAVLKCI